MIWIILGVLVMLFIGSIIIDNWLDEFGNIIVVGVFIFLAPALITLGIGIWLSVSVQSGSLLDQKIELAQTQNVDIENKIKIVVDNFLSHEKDTYKALKPDEVILAATTYPELQSNAMVQEQIKVYEENNKKITSLKEQKIDLSVKKWWLYFGN